MFQIKEEGKTLMEQRRVINLIKGSKLWSRKMSTQLGERTEEHSENFSKKLENTKKNHS